MVNPQFSIDSTVVSKAIWAKTTVYRAPRRDKITCVVLHSGETPELPTSAEGMANYFAKGSGGRDASAHYACDSDSRAQCVPENCEAFGAQGTNPWAVHIEQAGMAKQTGAQWGDAYSTAMVENQVIPLVAEICKRRGIPARLLTLERLLAGERYGITTHAITTAWRQATHLPTHGHTDPGANYPLQHVVNRVSALINPPVPSIPSPIHTGDQMTILGNSATPAPFAIAVIKKYRSKDANGYNDEAIAEIVNAYAATAPLAGVSLAVVLGQMVHETGWITSFWSARPQRNPAGIGVTGASYETEAQAKATRLPYAYDPSVRRYRLGVSFKAWAPYSVDAHVGRLAAYAIPKGQENPEQKRLIDIALAVRPLPDAYRGCAVTLRDLAIPDNPNHKGWAAVTGYGGRVAAKAMLFIQQ